MAIDSRGALYVPDFSNNRVLKYNNPFVSDSVADAVWGQKDFSGKDCNRGDFDRPTAATLCFHSDTNRLATNLQSAGVEVDAEGTVWVADTGNHRVLRFSANPRTGVISKMASLVLGQADFKSAEPGRTLDRLYAPSAVRIAPDGSAYVADTGNNRVLVFKPPFESGMEADSEFGSQLHHPTSIEFDPAGRGVWVNDAGNHMVELWDMSGTSVLKVLGKDSYRPERVCDRPLEFLPGAPHLCYIAGGFGIDSQGNVLVPVFLDTADVIRFATDGRDPIGQPTSASSIRRRTPTSKTSGNTLRPGRRGLEGPAHSLRHRSPDVLEQARQAVERQTGGRRRWRRRPGPGSMGLVLRQDQGGRSRTALGVVFRGTKIH